LLAERLQAEDAGPPLVANSRAAVYRNWIDEQCGQGIHRQPNYICCKLALRREFFEMLIGKKCMICQLICGFACPLPVGEAQVSEHLQNEAIQAPICLWGGPIAQLWDKPDYHAAPNCFLSSKKW